jgi:two-component system, OmpR family, response regulator
MKILVVEDDHTIANSIRRGFEQEHFVVDVAYAGDVGLDLALTEEYDVIVLDKMLPNIDGIEFIKKYQIIQKKAKVLMLTAKGDVKDKVTGLDAGADDYMSKPFLFDELVARVKALSRRPSVVESDKYQVRDVLLDTRDQKVTSSGRVINLSKKEYAIFEYLMRNIGRVCSKEQIISQVWDYDADILPNTIEAHIKKIREKMQTSPNHGQDIIQTIRGFGYKIESA